MENHSFGQAFEDLYEVDGNIGELVHFFIFARDS